ncbi:hypothetical protein B484DRAFT_456777 [Ochromonadaceae sp. CCMP2298]|nr:hypothetical protein B484DRAFT_456777 [Ochromonadaceae sp. CCMP2298]
MLLVGRASSNTSNSDSGLMLLPSLLVLPLLPSLLVLTYSLIVAGDVSATRDRQQLVDTAALVLTARSVGIGWLAKSSEKQYTSYCVSGARPFSSTVVFATCDTIALAPLLRMSSTELTDVPLLTAAQYSVPCVPPVEALTDTEIEVRWGETFSGSRSCGKSCFKLYWKFTTAPAPACAVHLAQGLVAAAVAVPGQPLPLGQFLLQLTHKTFCPEHW